MIGIRASCSIEGWQLGVDTLGVRDCPTEATWNN